MTGEKMGLVCLAFTYVTLTIEKIANVVKLLESFSSIYL